MHVPPIRVQVFDFFLNEGQRDWSSEFQELYGRSSALAAARRNKMKEDREAGAKSDLSMTDLTGTYKNDYLGDLSISILDGQLAITCRSDRHIVLEHWHYNTFLGKIIEYEHDQGDLIDFDRDADGLISFNLYGYEFKKYGN